MINDLYNHKIQSNRAFQEMLIPARKRLSGRSPAEIAKASGAVFHPDASVIEIASLNQNIRITIPEYECDPKPDDWHQLVILHYLDHADGAPDFSPLVPFGGLQDGLIRGTKFDHITEKELSCFIADKQPPQLQNVCLTLGAEILESKADLSVRFPFLPYYPVTLNVWFADDEFPAFGKMLLNKSADRYLTIEDAVTVGEIMLKSLKNTYRQMYGD